MNYKVQTNAESVIEKAFWLLAIGICTLGVNVLKDLANSVADLNGKVTVVIEKIDINKGRIDKLERYH